ncbi:MAG: hypothetical protein NUW21_15765 [Elusimicrobia bacterium]|nr:hypothetical protein [Elusimicrobiota bacterium]
MILAAVPVSLGASGANAQAVLRRCDRPMADAEAMVGQVAACSRALAGASVAKAAAPADTSVPEAIIAAASAEDFSQDLLAYAAFHAYTAGDLGACAPQPFPEWDVRCRELVLELRAARAAVGPRAEFVKACSQVDQSGTAAEGKQRAQCCALAAENIGRPDKCPGIPPHCSENQQDCRAFLASLGGDAGECKPIADERTSAAEREEHRLLCQGRALFVKASRARDVKVCGTSDYCRVLMGAGKQIAREQRARLSKTPAGRWYVSREWAKPAAPAPAPATAAAKFATTIRGFACEAPLNSPANQQAAAAVLASARSCYGDVELALSKVDASVARSLDEQEEKLIRLGLLLEKYFAAAVPARAPAAPAKTGR